MKMEWHKARAVIVCAILLYSSVTCSPRAKQCLKSPGIQVFNNLTIPGKRAYCLCFYNVFNSGVLRIMHGNFGILFSTVLVTVLDPWNFILYIRIFFFLFQSCVVDEYDFVLSRVILSTWFAIRKLDFPGILVENDGHFSLISLSLDPFQWFSVMLSVQQSEINQSLHTGLFCKKCLFLLISIFFRKTLE